VSLLALEFKFRVQALGENDMRKMGLLVLGVLVLFGSTPAWANHIDRGTSSMGGFVTSLSDCTDSGDVSTSDQAPCLFFTAVPSANIGAFDAFQVDVCATSNASGVCTSIEPGKQGSNGNGEYIYEIPNFASLTSVTLTLASALPDFGSFDCNSGNTQCVNNALPDPTLNPDGTWTFKFPPGTTTGNSANTTAWFFYSDPQGCDDSGGSENCSGSTGANNILGIKTPTTSTPEPASLALLGTGLLAVAGLVRRKRSKR
jgi:hypothetical protein